VWANVWQYDGLGRSEAMVRQSTRSGANRWAALTPPTPQSFTPSRVELSSGFFDIDAMVTVVERKRPRTKAPALILPILGRAAGPVAPVSRVAPRPATARLAREGDRAARRAAQRSDTLALIGFGLAWVATTAAGAVLVGQWMRPTHQALSIASVGSAVCAVSPAPSMPVPCPRPAWEPPLVAVKDLPEAPALAVVHGPIAHAASLLPAAHGPRLERRADAVPTESPGRGRRAKAPPAPRSLEDWIRGAVAATPKDSF
jgi:hypothetical protein